MTEARRIVARVHARLGVDGELAPDRKARLLEVSDRRAGPAPVLKRSG